MADGRFFPVQHPEFVAIAPGGRTVIVFEATGAFHILDTLLMTELDVPLPASS
jgi:hypothetical protein